MNLNYVIYPIMNKDLAECQEGKLSADELKFMKSLEAGKMIEEKQLEEDVFIKSEAKFKWYSEKLYDIDPQLGLVWKDYATISRQRKLAFQLIKQIGTNIFKGKSIMNISLPINIMSPDSVLQRLACNYRGLPLFAERTATTKDPVEKMKHYIAHTIAGLHNNLIQKKPLNPTLGETYQGCIGSDAYQVCCEQISHHPPISSLVLDCPWVTIYATQQTDARTYPNSAKVTFTGSETAIFKDEAKTTYIVEEHPTIRVGGTMLGKRTLTYENNLTITDVTNKIFAQARFDPDKQGLLERIFKKTEHHRPDFFKGFITKNKALTKDSSRKAFYSKDMISYFEGNWLENIKIDGDVYWEICTEEIKPLIDFPGSLESDSTKRPDSQAWKNEREDEAQKYKEMLENIQRNDRKLRESNEKERKTK